MPDTAGTPARHIRAVALAVFLVSWGTNVSTPFLIRYQERLDLGDSATMLIFTVYVVGIIGTLPVAGPVSDRFGRRAVVIPFTMLSAVSSLVLVLGRDDFAFLLLGRFLLGVVSGAVLGVSAAWLQELLGPTGAQRAAVMSTLITFTVTPAINVNKIAITLCHDDVTAPVLLMKSRWEILTSKPRRLVRKCRRPVNKCRKLRRA